MEGNLNIKVKHLNDKPIELQIEKQSTIFNVKEQLSSVINVPATEQKLIFKGRILKDDEIAGNVLEEGGAVHAVPWDNVDQEQSRQHCQPAGAQQRQLDAKHRKRECRPF
jgi:hypothetical protein